MKIKEFDILAKKYLDGNCTDQEKAILQNWYHKNENLPDPFLNVSEEIAAKKRIWGTLSINKTYWFKISIAASVLIAISLLYLNTKSFKSQTFAEEIEVKNTTSKIQKILLTDGSVVDLGQNSRLSYPENFAKDKRIVYLSGTATFDVAKNPNKPFLVLTEKLTTEVLGTKFLVKSSEKTQNIEVEVLEGKVMVYENTLKKDKSRVGAIITPNQKVTFDKNANFINIGIVERPKPISINEKSEFIFEDATLSKVLAIFKSSYKLDFIIENQMLEQCLITADLNELDMFSQLDILCKTIQAKYEIRGTSIYIYGPGCIN